MIVPDPRFVDGPIVIPIRGTPVPDGEGGNFHPIVGRVFGSFWNIARPGMVSRLQRDVIPVPATPHQHYAGDVRLANGTWRDTVFLQYETDEDALTALLEAGLATEI